MTKTSWLVEVGDRLGVIPSLLHLQPVLFFSRQQGNENLTRFRYVILEFAAIGEGVSSLRFDFVGVVRS